MHVQRQSSRPPCLSSGHFQMSASSNLVTLSREAGQGEKGKAPPPSCCLGLWWGPTQNVQPQSDTLTFRPCFSHLSQRRDQNSHLSVGWSRWSRHQQKSWKNSYFELLPVGTPTASKLVEASRTIQTRWLELLFAVRSNPCLPCSFGIWTMHALWEFIRLTPLLFSKWQSSEWVTRCFWLRQENRTHLWPRHQFKQRSANVEGMGMAIS